MAELIKIAEIFSDYIIPSGTAVLILGIIPAAAFFRNAGKNSEINDENN